MDKLERPLGVEAEPKNHPSTDLNISTKSFLVAIAIIFLLMALTYALTFILPGGEYSRTPDQAGHMVIDVAGGFRYVEGGLPFYRWLLSPLLVLTAEGSGTLIAVIIFLLVIGGAFTALNRCGLMTYMLARIVNRYGGVRYKLMAVLIFFFMLMGSLVGSFEEVIPMVPILVALSCRLGWDAVTGLAMSLLAAGCGFAAGVANPFTIGVAQGLAGLPMFSGIWLRMLAFVLIYLLLVFFVRTHAKKLEQRGFAVKEEEGFSRNASMDRALMVFGGILGSGILLVLSSGFLTFLQDYTMIIVALMFLAAGLISVRVSGMRSRALAQAFLSGILIILPSVIMILMAASIKYTMVESHILDTALHGAVTLAQGMPKGSLILFIYLICLVMNFFIPSGSAKAFLLIPLIVPLAQIFGVSSQLCIVAFAFGDGFSNVFYPTNPALLISLGLADLSYGDWAKWSIKFQLANLLLTSALLLFGLAVSYA